MNEYMKDLANRLQNLAHSNHDIELLSAYIDAIRFMKGLEHECYKSS